MMFGASGSMEVVTPRARAHSAIAMEYSAKKHASIFCVAYTCLWLLKAKKKVVGLDCVSPMGRARLHDKHHPTHRRGEVAELPIH